MRAVAVWADCDFNPRSPCGERHGRSRSLLCIRHFNPRSPCGERPAIAPPERSQPSFQSTLPVRGATSFTLIQRGTIFVFQSTLPVRGATIAAVADDPSTPISIHAPRAGSDRLGTEYCDLRRYFNPRSPCGERHSNAWVALGAAHFNPRSPCGERRPVQIVGYRFLDISIHAPRAGSDPCRGQTHPGR